MLRYRGEEDDDGASGFGVSVVLIKPRCRCHGERSGALSRSPRDVFLCRPRVQGLARRRRRDNAEAVRGTALCLPAPRGARLALRARPRGSPPHTRGERLFVWGSGAAPPPPRAQRGGGRRGAESAGCHGEGRSRGAAAGLTRAAGGAARAGGESPAELLPLPPPPPSAQQQRGALRSRGERQCPDRHKPCPQMARTTTTSSRTTGPSSPSGSTRCGGSAPTGTAADSGAAAGGGGAAARGAVA